MYLAGFLFFGKAIPFFEKQLLFQKRISLLKKATGKGTASQTKEKQEEKQEQEQKEKDSKYRPIPRE